MFTNSGYKKYTLQIVGDNNQNLTVSSVTIYQASTSTKPTLYKTVEINSKYTNPLTSADMTNNGFEFYCGVNAIDVVVLFSDGSQVVRNNITENSILIKVDADTVSKRKSKIDGVKTVDNNIKTVSITYGIKGVAGCDYNFVRSSEDGNVDNITLTGFIPAYSKVLFTEIVCLEGTNGYYTLRNSILVGSTSLIVEEDLHLPSTGSLYHLISSVTSNTVDKVATNLVIRGQPTNHLWSEFTAGKWVVIITYIDNSSFYS